MRRFLVLGAGVLLLLIMAMAFLGCGGGGGAASTIASITLFPTAVSLNRGATAQITAQALDANNNVVTTPTLAFHSSNAAITVSSNGLICAGQWDANFIRCQTTDNNNNLLPPGNASITATATVNDKTVTSSAVVVTDHERIDSIKILPDSSNPAVCVSQGGTAMFTAQAFSNDPAVCANLPGSPAAPCRLPDGTNGSVNTIGNIDWQVSPAQVATTGATTQVATLPVTVTAAAPGQGVVVGSVGPSGSTVSGSAPFTTCAVASIHVHQQNTTPTPPDTATSFTAPVGGTVPLVADVFDSNTPPVQLTSTIALTWLTSQPALASVSPSTAQGATVLAVAPGTASITAACLPPACNVNLNQAVYSDDVVTANITGTVASTVLVTTATAPANSTSSNAIIPIDTTTNNPGTAFTLPANVQVNSMVLTPLGNPAFLGTNCGTGTTGPNGAACSGLLRFDPTVATVGVPIPTITGTVLATDGTRVVVSDPANNQTFIAIAAGPAIEKTLPIANAIFIFIAAAPTGATESGNTVTITTTTPHGLTPGQSVMVVGVGVAGYDGAYTVQAVPSATSFTYTDPNTSLASSGGGYVTNGSAAAITADGSKIYIVTGGKLYIYNPGLPLQNRDLSGTLTATASSQRVAFFATGAMAYAADAGDDVVATCNDAIQNPVAVGGVPTHIAAAPNGTAMVDANSPNIDEVDASSNGGCPPVITNSFTSHGFAGVPSFSARQLIVTPNSQQAIILTSDHGVLVYDLGTKQTSVIALAGGAQPISGGVTPDSASLYVGANDGKVHRVDLKALSDAQTIAVNVCAAGVTCNPDFVVVRPVATVATLSSIAVTPATPTISVNGPPAQSCPAGAGNGEVCFTATGTFSDKTTRDLTEFVVWGSSNTLVAIIGPTTATPPLTTPGRARALAAGTVTISATSAGVTGSTTLTVLP